jgi:hypothetical protein
MIWYAYSTFSETHYWRFTKGKQRSIEGTLGRNWWYSLGNVPSKGKLIYDSEKGDDLLQMHPATEYELQVLIKVIFTAKGFIKP